MSTNTFDRPLIIEDEEDIKRFWDFMENAERHPIYRDPEFEEGMRRCAEKLKHIRLH